MKVVADLHNHSCLSPCASLELSPSVLARLARARGVELLALTDHNSARNAPAFADACLREGVAPLFGMEAMSSEEAHLVCLFGEPDAALSFSAWIRERLPPVPNDPERFGDQIVVDADENIEDEEGIWLGSALPLSFSELCDETNARGGLAIPAHIDRTVYGIIAQLGFLPDGPYAAVEAVRPLPPGAARNYTVITGSDAHYPEHVGRRPFGVDLPPDWKRADGTARLDLLRSALADGRVTLPW